MDKIGMFQIVIYLQPCSRCHLPLVLSPNILLIFGCETRPILIIPRLTGRLAERGLALLNVKRDVQEGTTTGRSCQCISVFICQEDSVDFFCDLSWLRWRLAQVSRGGVGACSEQWIRFAAMFHAYSRTTEPGSAEAHRSSFSSYSTRFKMRFPFVR